MQIDDALRQSLAPRADAFVLTLDPAFQGLPDTAHGGTVLAVFDAVADVKGTRRVAGRYLRRVPLGEPLRLQTTARGASVACALFDAAATPLVEGEVTAAALDGEPRDDDGEHPGQPLPISSTCFVCGADNPLGLRARLAFDDDRVWTTWHPLDRFRAVDVNSPGAEHGGPFEAPHADTALAPIAVTALADEVAFWLGAVATGEAGMTTDIAVTLAGTVAFGALTVSGARAAVRPRADDPRYLETRVIARDATGRLVASADITFVAIRGTARRLVKRMLTNNPPGVVQRVFPGDAR